MEVRAQLREGRWPRLCRGGYAALDPDEGDLPSWERAIRQHVRTAKAVVRVSWADLDDPVMVIRRIGLAIAPCAEPPDDVLAVAGRAR